MVSGVYLSFETRQLLGNVLKFLWAWTIWRDQVEFFLPLWPDENIILKSHRDRFNADRVIQAGLVWSIDVRYHSSKIMPNQPTILSLGVIGGRKNIKVKRHHTFPKQWINDTFRLDFTRFFSRLLFDFGKEYGLISQTAARNRNFPPTLDLKSTIKSTLVFKIDSVRLWFFFKFLNGGKS